MSDWKGERANFEAWPALRLALLLLVVEATVLFAEDLTVVCLMIKKRER